MPTAEGRTPEWGYAWMDLFALAMGLAFAVPLMYRLLMIIRAFLIGGLP